MICADVDNFFGSGSKKFSFDMQTISKKL